MISFRTRRNVSSAQSLAHNAQDVRRVLEEPPPIKRKADDTLESFLERAERWLIESTLDELCSNVAAAAQRLERPHRHAVSPS
jgi:hypothetical protein